MRLRFVVIGIPVDENAHWRIAVPSTLWIFSESWE